MVDKMQKNNKTSKGKAALQQKILEALPTDFAEDDFLNALGNKQELHMDYAHSISLGYHNELYYLIFVVGGVNFLWATPSTSRLEPE